MAEQRHDCVVASDDDFALLQTTQRLGPKRDLAVAKIKTRAKASSTSSEIWEGSRRVRKTQTAPVYQINLDLPPQQRWAQAVQDYAALVMPISFAFKKWLNQALTPQEQLAWVSALRAVTSDELQQEIDGIYQVLSAYSNLTLAGNDTVLTPSDIGVLASSMYDMQYPHFDHACSGNLVAMPNGTVIHGRNLDYHMAGGSLSSIIVTAEFVQGGVPLFTAPVIVGAVGIHTGMRYNGWTFEQNTHHHNNRNLNLQVLQQGGQPFGVFFRIMMQTVPTFQVAQAIVMNTTFMAPSFFVMSGAGPYEGIVITADRQVPEGFSANDVYPTPYLYERVLSPTVDRWYFVQTNDELWGYPEDTRRFAEQQVVEHVGRGNATLDTVLSGLRIPPAFRNTTVFTWAAVAATGAHKIALAGETVPCLFGLTSNSTSGACA